MSSSEDKELPSLPPQEKQPRLEGSSLILVAQKVIKIVKKNNTEGLRMSLAKFLSNQKPLHLQNDKLKEARRDILQQKLALLLHTYYCEDQKCDIFCCQSIKNLWSHMTTCPLIGCSVALCKSSWKVLTHWSFCVDSSCDVCPTFKRSFNLDPESEMSASSSTSGLVVFTSPRRSQKADSSNVVKNCLWKPKCEKVWTGAELKSAFNPLLDKMFAYDKEVEPFMRPVDPKLDLCPDYFDIVRRPMDFGTIKSKLDRLVYKDPWEIINEIYLVFGNAWLYNKKCSVYHKYACKLADVFEAHVDAVMRGLGFCCGQRYEFTPLPKYCDSRLWCNIPVLAEYYSYNDQYVFCERCFQESPSSLTVSICKDPTTEPLIVDKRSFVKKRNLERKLEKFIKCTNCGRLNHVICVMYLDEGTSTPFVCRLCQCNTSSSSSSAGVSYRPTIYRASDIPHNNLSTFLENRVTNFFIRKKLDSGKVSIRVVASSKEITTVKPRFKKHFPEMSNEYPYISKAVFAFQEFNNQDVCFFGMHVQEYGSDVPAPNARRVYLAYLDSVQYFEPAGYRTSLYHEILIAYMQYIKNMGFVSLHIWSCPPCEGDDYIFNCHPVKQKIPKAKRLQEWYRRLLEKATNENIVSNFTDILSYAVSNDLKNAADMPYFDGDFWPSSLEDNIKEIEKSENTNEKNCAGKPPKASQDSKTRTNQKTQNKGKKVLPSTHGDVLVDKIYSTLGKYREMFFVVEFFTPEEAMTLLPICDLDPLMPNDLMHERSSFLVMFRERLAEFSSLRRAKHSTCIMLHEIINNNINSSANSTNALAGPDARGSVSTVSSAVQGGSGSNVVGVGGGDVAAARRFVCSGCGSKEGDFYGCSKCETWKSCPACLASLQHIHPTHLISTTTALKKKKIIGASGVDALEHASFCPGGPEGMCYKEGNEEDVARCQKFKSAFTHAPSCENRLDCPSCRTLVRLALLHARKCTFATPGGTNSNSAGTATDGNNNNSTTSTITTATELSVTSATNKIANTEQVQPPQQQHITECPVIFCTVARSKLEQLMSKQRKMGERMLKRRTAAMMVNEENDGSASGGSGGGASSSSSAASERVDSRQDFQRMGSM